MNVRQKIKYFIDRTFHDEIIAAKPPVEWYEIYRDIGPRVEGYVVPVVRKYSGKTNILFPIDYGMFGLVPAKSAAKNAADFYVKIMRKLENNNGKAK